MLLSMLAATAMAKDPQWGAGVHLGTWAIPGQYPSSLPKVDPEGDGTKVAMTSVDKVRGDFLFGVEGWFWVDDAFRLGLLPGVDVGSKFTDVHAILAGDFVFVNGDQLDVFAGAGVGAASSTFRGTQGEEKLVVPNYPLRANIGAMLTPTEFLAPQLRLIGQWNIPSSHRYTTVDGTELDKKQVGTGVYVNVGIELSVLYGNFGK
jgi:hypothetical protein